MAVAVSQLQQLSLGGLQPSETEFKEWTAFVEQYRDELPAPPYLAPTKVDPPAAYLSNQYGRPETPAELLDFYTTHRHLHSPISPNEPGRRAIIQRFGLDNWKGSERINEVAKVARAYFNSTVLVTVVAENKVHVLASASVDDDCTDWSCAVGEMQHSFSLCRHSVLGTEEKAFVMHDSKADWRLTGNQLFHSGGGYLGSYISSPFNLPTLDDTDRASLPMGGFCLMSPNARPAGSFTKADQSLLANLGTLAAQEIVRVFEESERARAASQARFLTEFIQLAIAGNDGKKAEPILEVLRSPGNEAAAAKRSSELRACSLSEAFGLAATRIATDLTNSEFALVIDVRELVHSSTPEGSYGWSGQLRHAVLLGHGGGGDREAAAQLLKSQDHLQSLMTASVAWSPNTRDTQALDFLRPPGFAASVALPIYSRSRELSVIVFLAAPLFPFVLESQDETFVQNLGQLCIASLAKEQASSEERARLAFISRLSHQLRTPLHEIAGHLELMNQSVDKKASNYSSDQSTQSLRPLLKAANSSVDVLKATVDDILVLGRYSDRDEAQSAFFTQHELVNLPSFIHDTLVSVKNGLQSRVQLQELEVIFEVESREQGWTAEIDKAALRRIIVGIVENACVFTAAGFVRVTLGASCGYSRSDIKIVVADSGPGMDVDFIHEGLFVAFQKRDLFTSGNGLGMPLVKHLVSHLKGTINVSSVVGEGTTVTVVIPADLPSSAAHAGSVQVLSDTIGTTPTPSPPLVDETADRPVLRSMPSEAASSVGSSTFDSSSLSRGSSSTSFDTSPTTPPTARPLRILAAEDNLISQNILRGLFKDTAEYELVIVGDGEQAVVSFRQGHFRPDVTLMDIQMPIKDGIAASHEIRQYEQAMGWPRHRIVALSALSNPEDLRAAMDNGGPIDAWITKGGRSLKELRLELVALKDLLT